jgi:drug/metabolite transporter (DMT)-like permease
MTPDVALNTCILISLLCWGAWGIFDKLSLKYAPSTFVMLGLFAFSIPCAIGTVIWLNMHQPGWTVSPEILGWTFLGFFCYSAAMICYLKALNISEASYVLGATASYPVLLQFLSALFLGEALVPARLGGSLLVALGVTGIGASVSRETAKAVPTGKKKQLIFFVITATLLWGVWGIFDKKAVTAGGALTAYLAHCIWEMLFMIPLGIYVLKKYKSYFNSGWKLWFPVTGSAVCINVGSFTYMTALSLATASYVIVITGCYPLIMYLLALAVLKEKFNVVRLIGIILVTVGGVITHGTEGL